MLELCNERKKSNLCKECFAELRHSESNKGTRALICIIESAISDDKVLNNISKFLDDIASNYEVTSNGLYEIIKYAIKSSWEVTPQEIRTKYFGERDKEWRPTVKQYIVVITNYIRSNL